MRASVEFSPSYAMLNVELESGESIKAETGAMVAQQGVSMSTGMGGGGIFGGISRMVSGESFSLNTFTAERGSGWVRLAPSTPGDILTFDIRPGENLFLQSGSFLACSENVQTDSKFQGFRGFFSGESMFFLRTYTERGEGTVFYNAYGAIKKLPVTPGEELVVDTGHLVAFTDDVEYSIGKVGGIRSLITGGEGLVMKFKGDGHVWIQTRNLESLVSKLMPFLPKRDN